MPRRSNKFQRLIYLIQHQLADGATVTESKLLPDVRSGRAVEVDIVVEGTVGEVQVVIGIECTSGRRPATVEWINEMTGKHADLPVNKTVLVSRSGFTAEAVAKASMLGIEALPILDAEARDWADWLYKLDALRFAGFTLSPQQVSATISTAGQLPADKPVVPDAQVQEPGSEGRRSLKEYVNAILRNDRVFLHVTRWWLKLNSSERPMSFTFQITWDCPPNTTIQAPSGNALGLTKLIVLVRAEVRDAPFAARVSKFRERNIVHGEVPDVLTDDGKSDVLFTLIERDGTFEKGATLVVNPDSSESRVVTMKFPRTDDADS